MANSPTTPANLAPRAHHIRVERTARYYTLGASNAPRAIWIVLHGYSQLAGEFIRYFSDIANDETLIVAPEAMNRYYTVSHEKTPARDRPVGATWMTREDRDSEIADYVEYLDALYEEVAAGAAQSGVAVNVIGFSQGAATATRWIAHGKSHVDRLVLWGGLIPPDTDLSHGARSLRDVPLTLVVGSRDHYIAEPMLAAERARLDAARIPYEVIAYDGGHAINRAVFAELNPAGGR